MNSVFRVGLLIVIAIIQLLAPAVAAPPDQPITVEPKVYTGPLEPRAQKAPEQLRGDANHALGNRLIRLQTLSANAAKAMAVQDPVGPTKIGFGRDVPSLKAQQDTTNQLDWKPVTGGMIGSLAINSNGAAALRVGIRIQSIPDSAEVRFFSDNATEVQLVSGKTIMDLIKQNLAAGDPEETARVYWSPVIQGEIAGVEIFIPDGVQPDEVQISIPQVSHLTVSPQSGGLNPQLGNPGDSAACELDAMCYPDWQTTGNSVARIILTIGGSTRYCTGTLLNDKNGSLIPYFLTANHCISDQTTANSLQAYWFYHSTACNSGVLYTGVQVTGSGASLLYHADTTDVSFLRLNSQPPLGVTFSGWSANASVIGDASTGLHNPQGDLQKISFGTVNGYSSCYSTGGGQFSCNPSDVTNGTFLKIIFTQGITEGGSSGSGLFSGPNKYFIGQLYGGNNSCAAPSDPIYYGSLQKSYNNGSLGKWLSPQAYSVAVTPETYDFGSLNTGSTATKTFTITNNGSQGVTFNTGSPSVGGDSFYISGSTCGSSLSARASCNVTVTYGPAVQGSYSGGLSVSINESTDNVYSIISGTATGSPAKYTLAITKSGTGSLTSSPAGIDCGVTCSAPFNASSVVSLYATAGTDYTFTGWSGACVGSDYSCTVRMTAAQNVTATFTKIIYKAPLYFQKNSQGFTTPSPAGSICPGFTPTDYIDCQMYDEGTTVSVKATPNAGYGFEKWWGDCVGSGDCNITMKRGGNSVWASFLNTYSLTINNNGNGSVTSSPSGIDCGNTCSSSFLSGTSVTLTATPNPNYVFIGWSASGLCSGVGPCVISIFSNTNVTATFADKAYNVSVNVVGNGSVKSTPAGIDCGIACSALFDRASTVNLVATADYGYTFTGWSISNPQPGDSCPGTGGCRLSILSAKNVTASFIRTKFALNITSTGTGSVVSSPVGIDCGSKCSSSFDQDTQIVLTATPAQGFVFGGWTGDCSGFGFCNVTMTSIKNVKATFLPPRTLTVTKSGVGGVISSPGGIDCGSTCKSTFSSGTVVSLSAAPDLGWAFTSWGGDCSGNALCSVTMDLDKVVQATFSELPKYNLTVRKQATGLVTSLPQGIDCGGSHRTCIASVSQTILTATPNNGYAFKSWVGCPQPSGDKCSLTLSKPTTINATFSELPKFTLKVTKNKLGTVTSDPAAINCKANVTSCSSKIFSGTKVTLTATPSAGKTFVGWTGACSGKDVCSLTMDGSKGVNATFQ